MLGTLTRGSLVAALAALTAVTVLTSAPAHALDKVRFGKSVPNSFAFSTGRDRDRRQNLGDGRHRIGHIGIPRRRTDAAGAHSRCGGYRGRVRTSLGFRAKGVPAIGVAAMYGPPANLALTVLASSSSRRSLISREKTSASPRSGRSPTG